MSMKDIVIENLRHSFYIHSQSSLQSRRHSLRNYKESL